MALTKVTNSMIEGSMVNAVDFGFSTSATGTQNAAAFHAAVAATPSAGTLFIPAGNYNVDPLTVTKQIRILGESARVHVAGTRLTAAGNQTHILMFKGGAGTFPTNFIFGIGLDYVSIFGNNNTISDAGLVIWNAGMLNSIGLNISNCYGHGIRLTNAQDLHFVSSYIADSGDNDNQKAVIYCDPTSNNNVNNVYFTDFHFESIGWSMFYVDQGSTDQFQFVNGKFENRVNYAGRTATNLAFPLFHIENGNRFVAIGMSITASYLYSEPTFKFEDGFGHAVTNCKVFNAGVQTSNFIRVEQGVDSITTRDNGGRNIGTATNFSTKAASCYVEDPFWSNNNANSSDRAIIDSISPDLTRIVSTAGGNYTYNYPNSLTGTTFVLNGANNPVPGVKLPIGYPGTVTVYWRVLSDLAGRTLTVGYKDKALAVTQVTNGVAAPTSFGNVSLVLDSTAMQTAYQATIFNEQGDNNLYIDGVWLVYS